MNKISFTIKYYIAVVIVLILALVNSQYLFWTHYLNYTDINYASFCAISKSLNCDTVAQSNWSVLLGIPVAAWGGLGYLLFGCILFVAIKENKKSEPLWAILVSLSCVFSVVSLFFIYISTIKIHSYCLLCMASYVFNFTLFFLSWKMYHSYGEKKLFLDWLNFFQILRKSILLKFFLGLIILLIFGMYSFLPKYWQFQSFPPITENIPTGLTHDGHPWIGATDPVLTINEYTDYQCFQCYKTHYMLRRLIAENPDKIRLVHHHYPMDHEVNAVVVPEPFHVGSGRMAMLAIYAQSKDKFWQVNDVLYELGRKKENIDVSLLAQKVGIPAGEFVWALESKEVHERLRYDIWHGMKLGITGTPTFVIGDKVYASFIPPEILKKALK